jgi:tetratricopeptide (TPR) repeat protein
LTYANALSGPFIFDDDSAVTENVQIRSLSPSVALFPHREAPTAGRPVVNYSFAINYALGGLNVTGYHLANIAVHILAGLALFGVARRTLALPGVAAPLRDRSLELALAIALIWMVHPLNSEAVDYVTQRTESLMSLFYLLTMYCAIRGWTAAAIACCALGMASKESMVSAPVMVVLYDRAFRYDSLRRACRERRVLYGGLAATWILLVLLMQSGPRMHSAGFNTGVSAWTYLVNQAAMLARYLQLAIWPRSLVIAYGPPLPLSLADVAPQALLIVALLALTAVAYVRWPMLGFLGAWFFLTLAPTSTIVPIATEVGAERRMYLALAALITLAVVAVGPRIRRPAAAAALAVVCAILAVQTLVRARDYRSSLAMAKTVLERRPTGFAHALYGVELSIAGRHEEALPHLREGVQTYSRAHYHLGGELFNAGKTDEALGELQQFVRENPQLLEAVRARTMIGRALMKQGKIADAIEQFRLVLTMTPANDAAHVTAIGFLADALFAQEKYPEAIAQYRTFLAARPNDSGGQMNYAIALVNTGHAAAATAAFHRAVELNPSDTTARRNLASHLFNLGQLDEAAAEARAILQIKPDVAAAHDLLGRVLGSKGQLGAARAEFERALQLDPHDEQAREDLALLLRTLGSGIRDQGLGIRD